MLKTYAQTEGTLFKRRKLVAGDCLPQIVYARDNNGIENEMKN